MLSSITRLLPDLQDPLCLLEAVRWLPSFMIYLHKYVSLPSNGLPLTTESYFSFSHLVQMKQIN